MKKLRKIGMYLAGIGLLALAGLYYDRWSDEKEIESIRKWRHENPKYNVWEIQEFSQFYTRTDTSGLDTTFNKTLSDTIRKLD